MYEPTITEMALALSPMVLITIALAYVAYYFTRKKKSTNPSKAEPS